MCVWLFWSSDAQAQGAVLNTWADVLMLLATLLRRNQAAVGPSVAVALGKHWQRFSGDKHTHTYTPKKRKKECYKEWRQARGKGRQNETEEYKEKTVANMMKAQRDGGEKRIEEFRWKRMC